MSCRRRCEKRPKADATTGNGDLDARDIRAFDPEVVSAVDGAAKHVVLQVPGAGSECLAATDSRHRGGTPTLWLPAHSCPAAAGRLEGQQEANPPAVSA